ncbi:hypothetical protein R2R35_11565 [Anaerocolumna sp. AGMB13020]|uniref:hypothetical protein n=1 Tax=Anaerocolumna sp. AGMB13020 TaxID=3081750 RepID=UPI002954FAF6|nr:hypothetical protein [Anaerocolumna sp. AGMB13020]WOO39087.1 hypothetical protein R2R35_11565 [Anaerocolumna sp. AGMB13020]
MKDNQKVNILMILVSIGLILGGVFVIDYDNRNIAGICIGFGSGLASLNVVHILFKRMLRKHPEYKRQSEIDAKDERSIAITNKAKAKAYDKMIYIMIGVPFVMIFTNSPLWMILTVIAFYLFGYSLQLYYIVKYNKVM